MTDRPQGSQRFTVIGCEVLFREVCFLTASCPHRVDHVWLSQGLHDLGAEKMRARIQAAVDAVDPDSCDAICLAFALCNNGIAGLAARTLPVVIPRAHDCITLFMGSRERYREHFDSYPGTYYLTSGWIERDDSEVAEERGASILDQMGVGLSLDQLREQYGEDNAAFLADMLGDLTRHYSRITYIDMGLDTGPGFREVARRAAAERGWEFDVLQGDLRLLKRLLWGQWDDDMIVLKPGEEVCPTFDRNILCACAAPGCAG